MFKHAARATILLAGCWAVLIPACEPASENAAAGKAAADGAKDVSAQPAATAADPAPATPDAASSDTPSAPPTTDAPPKSEAPQEQAQTAAAPKTPADAPKPPKIVALSPAHGTEGVPYISEIRIQFDQPMDPASTDLEWMDGFFLPKGAWRYETASNEFVIPAEFKPFEFQRIVINPQADSAPTMGFRSVAGVSAGRSEWTFHTARDEDDDSAPMPEVIDIDPPMGSEVGQIVPIRITFDQPMVPDHFHQVLVIEDGLPNGVSPYYHLRYIPDRNQFELPIRFGAGWIGTIRLTGFRSELRSHAPNIDINYSVTDEPFSPDEARRIAVAGRNGDLIRLLGKMEENRARLRSVSESVRATRYAPGYNDLYGSMRSGSAVFRYQAKDMFYADVSGMLGETFIVGNDAAECWWISQAKDHKQIMRCEADRVGVKNVSICDPFHLSRYSPTEAIRKWGLELLGPETLDGRPTQVIQSMATKKEDDGSMRATITRWWIDSRTYVPIQVVQEWASGAQVVQQITYDSVNEPMKAAAFSPPSPADLRDAELPPITPDYYERFVNAVDPCNGQMNVRWGQYGKAGEISEGLQ